MQMGWRWDFTFEILPQMAIATLNTILAAGVGYAIALVVGLFFLLGQKTPFKIVNWINREIVEFIRSTPLLIQLFFVYFVLKFILTISIDSLLLLLLTFEAMKLLISLSPVKPDIIIFKPALFCLE